MIDTYFEIIAIRTIKENRRKTIPTILKKCEELGLSSDDVDRLVDEMSMFFPESFVDRYKKARQKTNVDAGGKPPECSNIDAGDTSPECPNIDAGKTSPERTNVDAKVKKKNNRGGKINAEKTARILAYYDEHPSECVHRIARACGVRPETVNRALERERGVVREIRPTLLEKRDAALRYFEQNPKTTLDEAARFLGYTINACQVFRRFGVGPWTTLIEARKRRYQDGYEEECDKRFADVVFDPQNPVRPYLEETYRESLLEGYEGLFYVGETWSRYYECYIHKRRGESLQIDKDGTKRWSTHGIHSGMNYAPMKDNAPRVFSVALQIRDQ